MRIVKCMMVSKYSASPAECSPRCSAACKVQEQLLNFESSAESKCVQLRAELWWTCTAVPRSRCEAVRSNGSAVARMWMPLCRTACVGSGHEVSTRRDPLRR